MIPTAPLILIASLALADDGPLSVADLDAYRSALRPAEEGAEPAVPVGFDDLWEHPERFARRRVAVEGRARRRFRQGAIGEYPPLVELWLLSDRGDPTCLVYPEPTDGDPTPLGGTVRFVGTYQRRITYKSGDVDRLAPLVVGPEAPEVLRRPPTGPWRPVAMFGEIDWLLGLIVAAMVASAIVRLVLLRPRPTRRSNRDREDRRLGPPPEFVDGEDRPYNAESPTDGEPSDPDPGDHHDAPDH